MRSTLATPLSNGQSEGHITKLKLLEQEMYRRANFDLLRRRVLLAAETHSSRESRRSGPTPLPSPSHEEEVERS